MQKDTIVEYTETSGKILHVIGMINIQFIVCGEDVYVIEVNPRSSRTVPYISKVTGIPIVPLATKVILGHTIPASLATSRVCREADYIAIKMPVFSFEKIRGADIALGPEMKSTGECLRYCKDLQRGSLQSIPRRRNQPAEIQKHDHHRKG